MERRKVVILIKKKRNNSKEQKKETEDQNKTLGEGMQNFEKADADIVEEVKADENILDSGKKEFETAAQYKEQVKNIQSLLDNCSQVTKLVKEHGNKIELEVTKQISRFDLVQLLNGKENSFIPQRLLNPKEIINKINKWLESFHCCIKDCPYQPKFIYEIEDSSKIYCEFHANEINDLSEVINFENKVNI